MSERVAPQNPEAEESVLGAMLDPVHSKRAIADASEILLPGDFYRESLGRIYRTILSLDGESEPVDAVTLAARLDREGHLEGVGGKLRIHELASLSPPISTVRYHCGIVKEQSTRRALVRAGGTIAELGYEGLGETGDIVAQAEAALSLVTNEAVGEDFVSIGDATSAITDEVLAFAEEGRERFGLKTGYPGLDDLTTGFHPGNVVILAARPSVGKSALAQNISFNVAWKKTGVLYFTLEMSREELAVRQLSRMTGIHTKKIVTANLDLHEQADLKKAVSTLAGLPLYVEDNPAMRMPELRAKVRRSIRQHKEIGLLVVDYLQLMAGGGEENRQQEVSTISRGLKVLAKELGIPVLALSQLNREMEYHKRRPILSDLRESGSIEQDADVVMFLHRPGMVEGAETRPENENDAELIIRKNRMMSPGEVNLTFNKKKELYLEPAKLG